MCCSRASTTQPWQLTAPCPGQSLRQDAKHLSAWNQQNGNDFSFLRSFLEGTWLFSAPHVPPPLSHLHFFPTPPSKLPQTSQPLCPPLQSHGDEWVSAAIAMPTSKKQRPANVAQTSLGITGRQESN